MNSTIAWLDTSSDEQRRVRELIALFSEKGPSPRIVDTVLVDYAAVGSVAARWAS